jgi:hypothetical protein
MSQERFDNLTRALSTRQVSRGRMLKMGATAALGSVLGRGGLLWSPGPSRGCSLDSPELECDFHIYAYPEQDAELQETRSLKVELQGFDLPGEEKASVESEIRRLVEARAAEYQQPHPAVTRPATRWASQPGEIDVSLTGLHLPDAELSRIESRIRRVMAEVTPLSTGAAAKTTKTTKAEVSVASAVPGETIYLDESLDCAAFRPAVGEENRIALYLPEDNFRLTVRNGAEANPPLGPDETTVALARRQWWDKRITWTAPQRQTVWGTRSIECTNYSAPMRLRDPWYSRQYTTVFEKPKFLGEWTSMYHWYPPQFMSLFGGQITRYCWLADNVNNPPPEGTTFRFRTSFEDYFGERMPDWRNSPHTSNSIANVDGPPYCELTSGPQAHVGRTFLTYGGRAKPGGAVGAPTARFCYFKVLALQWPITHDTGLVYWIYPRNDLGRFVGLDFVLTDGSRLRSTDAVDQNGHRMHPGSGHGGNIPLNQWSPIKCHVGRWLAGKTIDRILVGFDRERSSGWFNGYIDDILIATGAPHAGGC